MGASCLAPCQTVQARSARAYICPGTEAPASCHHPENRRDAAPGAVECSPLEGRNGRTEVPPLHKHKSTTEKHNAKTGKRKMPAFPPKQPGRKIHERDG